MSSKKLKRKIVLDHFYHTKDNPDGYNPGEEIEVDEAEAQRLLSIRGAAHEPNQPPRPAPDRKPEKPQDEDPGDSEPFVNLDLPDGTKDLLVAAGLETVDDVRQAMEAEGGLAAIEGIGKVKAEQIAEEIGKVS